MKDYIDQTYWTLRSHLHDSQMQKSVAKKDKLL